MKKIELNNKQIADLIFGKTVKCVYITLEPLSPMRSMRSKINVLGTNIVAEIKEKSIIPSSDHRELYILNLRYKGRLVNPIKRRENNERNIFRFRRPESSKKR